MLKKVLSIILVSLFIIQCNSLPSRSDNTPPFVELIYPSEGDVISSNTKIKIGAYDNDKLSLVWATVDGNYIGETNIKSDTERDYIIDFDITNYKDKKQHYIQAFAQDKSGNINSTLRVNFVIAQTDDNTNPVVSIVNPQSGQTVEDTVKIVAIATDDRAVKQVAFFVDGDSVGVDETYPYSFDWDTKPYADSTNHTILAKAFDTGNNTAVSPVVFVTVYPSVDITPPTAVITYPLNTQIIFGTVTVTVEASDNKGIQKVEFFIDGDSVFTDTHYPYQYEWDTDPYADGGSHSIYAKAYDLSGNSAITSINTVVVSSNNSDDIIPPTVVILYPINLSSVSGTINIRTDIQDNVGVSYAEFYIDGDSLTTDYNGKDGWSASWDTTPYADGSTHSVYIKAYDSAGNAGTAFVSVTVTP